ncbi:MAG: thioredoxin-disulfide reductase [Deltaproteobacteria bacterium]|nr:thioredoxin-disulfide reductase [Deltaproteobacteria bacterium]
MRKIVIIGAGPAGLTAAIYAARANMAPLCIEGVAAGGQLMTTSDIENYPGFPRPVTGPELMQLFRDQASRFGTEFITDDVTRVDFTHWPFKVWIEDRSIDAATIVISTGASARWLGIESEQALRSHGVSACATCDGFFFRGQDVAVVGGGDTAMEEALYLSKLCSTVTVIHRRDKLRASKIMQERAAGTPNMKFVWNSKVLQVEDVDQKTVTGVVVEDVATGEKKTVAVQGLFVAIGHEPNTALFRGLLEVDENGYLRTKPGTTQTSIAGVFACGDVQDHAYRQAVTAAGTGCMAALEAERWLGAKGV